MKWEGGESRQNLAEIDNSFDYIKTFAAYFNEWKPFLMLSSATFCDSLMSHYILLRHF